MPEPTDDTTPANTTPSMTPSPGLTPPPAVTPVAPAAALPPENLPRGLLLALLAIPAGVLVYMIIWNLGYIASIAGFIVAFAAYFLYRFGSGGRVSIKGGLVIAAITLVTLIIAFVLGEVWDYVAAVSAQTGLSVQDILSTPGLGGYVISDLTSPQYLPTLLGNAGLTFLFGVLGCAGVLFNIFRQAKTTQAMPPVQPPAA
ncbi:MAG: hypothetical protein ABIR17_06875 [Pseudolysinimonas sp.]|uniref:hypothetical protein n=1 Tax=Pseudolysinimonas sp. TaxID=2680009 RepID=UPI003263A0A1